MKRFYFQADTVLRLFLLVVVILGASVVPERLYAGQGFVIVKSSNIQNYNNAIVAFKTTCSGVATEFDLQDDMARGKKIMAEVEAQDPAAVFVVGAKAAAAAKKYLNPSVPVIYAIVLNPEKYGLSGGNITGVMMDIPVDSELQSIKGIIPYVKKLGTLYNPRKSQDMVDAAKAAAEKVGIELVTARVSSSQDTVYALNGLAAGIDAFWLVPDSTVVNKESIGAILRYSFQNQIPVIAFHKKFVKAGVLLSLSPIYEKMGAQACEMATKVAGGTPVTQIPAESPRYIEMAVNVKTARSLNLQDISMNAFGFAARMGYKIEAMQ